MAYKVRPSPLAFLFACALTPDLGPHCPQPHVTLMYKLAEKHGWSPIGGTSSSFSPYPPRALSSMPLVLTSRRSRRHRSAHPPGGRSRPPLAHRLARPSTTDAFSTADARGGTSGAGKGARGGGSAECEGVLARASVIVAASLARRASRGPGRRAALHVSRVRRRARGACAAGLGRERGAGRGRRKLGRRGGGGEFRHGRESARRSESVEAREGARGREASTHVRLVTLDPAVRRAGELVERERLCAVERRCQRSGPSRSMRVK